MTLTLFVLWPSLVVTLVKCLTGTPDISMSLCRVASGIFIGIPCRTPVLTGFCLVDLVPSSTTVTMEFGRVGRCVRV